MCKVSVLVPVYNVAQYLPKCLDSILAQTLQDIEVVCIDDGSTDNSGNILDTYAAKDSRIHVIHQPNGGYGKAMNAGIHIARGEYIGIVESDDFVAKDMFEKLYNEAVKHNAEMAKSNYFRYWAMPKETIKPEPLLKHLPYGQAIHPWAYQKLFRIQPSIWSGIYSREFLSKHHIAFLETPGAAYQDTSFTFKVFALAERAVLLEDALLYYRQDNGNSSIHSSAKASFVRLEYDEINTFLNQKPNFSALYSIRNEAMFHTYLWNYVRLKQELCEQFLYDMQNDFRQLQQSGQLDITAFHKTDARRLQMILNDIERFIAKEKIIMPLRKKISNRAYRALLIGRTAGIPCMISAVIKKILHKS